MALLDGDVNSDGLLNVSDIIIVVSMILGTVDSNYIADLNDDGAIDVIDVVMIVNEILNN